MVAPSLAKAGPNFGRSLEQNSQRWSKLAEVCQMWLKLASSSPNFGQVRASPGQSWPKFAADSPKIRGKHRPKLAKLGPSVAQVRPMLPRVRPNLTNVDQIWPKFGQTSAQLPREGRPETDTHAGNAFANQEPTRVRKHPVATMLVRTSAMKNTNDKHAT